MCIWKTIDGGFVSVYFNMYGDLHDHMGLIEWTYTFVMWSYISLYLEDGGFTTLWLFAVCHFCRWFEFVYIWGHIHKNFYTCGFILMCDAFGMLRWVWNWYFYILHRCVYFYLWPDNCVIDTYQCRYLKRQRTWMIVFTVF